MLLGENEQMVLAVDGRALPSLSDMFAIFQFSPTWFMAPLIIIHRVFRLITYFITTERVFAVEPNGRLDTIELDEIVRMKGTRSSLMVYGRKRNFGFRGIQVHGFSSRSYVM